MSGKQFTPEQIAARTAEGLARMAADEKSTKRRNQHLQPRRRAGKLLRGMSFERLGHLSQESLERYTFDGTKLVRKAKPERRKKARRDLRAGRRPYQRPAAARPVAPPQRRERKLALNPQASRLAAVKGAMESLGLKLAPHGDWISFTDRCAIAALAGLSLSVVQDGIAALSALPFAKASRKGACNLPRRKQKWLRTEARKRRDKEEILGWPKDEELPRRLRKVISQRRKVREAFDAR